MLDYNLAQHVQNNATEFMNSALYCHNLGELVLILQSYLAQYFPKMTDSIHTWHPYNAFGTTTAL